MGVYGMSKALLNSYTMMLAREHPKLKINSCSPGYILTDLTAGMGATKRPEVRLRAPPLGQGTHSPLLSSLLT